MNNKKYFFLIISLSLLLLMWCSDDNNHDLVDKTRFIYHAMGKTKVPINPKRVVTLTNEATEAIMILGIKPVGIVKSDISVNSLGIEEVGLENKVDIDKISFLQPDLIIGSKNLHEDIYEKLSFLAPTIFVEDTFTNTKDNFIKYAETVNKEYLCDKILSYYNYKATELKSIIKDTNNKISIIGFFPDKTYLLLKYSFIGKLLSEIELKQVECIELNNKKHYLEITKENFIDIARESDIILYFTFNDKSKARQMDWFNTISKLSKGKSIYRINKLTAKDILKQLELHFS